MSRSVIVSRVPRSLRRLSSFVAPLLALACSGDEGPRTPLNQIQARAESLPPGHPSLGAAAPISAVARAALDSGNVAFRMKQYDRALGYYRKAAQAAPAHASPWFGIFMVAQATGNTVLRDSAQREVQKRTVDSPDITDSTLRNTHPVRPKSVTS